MDSSKFLIVGANGQLGKALQLKYPDATAVDAATLDITNKQSIANFDWSKITHIINAAAYTNVDEAETDSGRVDAWSVNATGVANLAGICLKHDLTLVHISSEYVFDGHTEIHTELEPFSPLGVYGTTKAAGDIAASLAPKQYTIRVTWLIGDGKNFVRSIYGLGQKKISPNVVADQFGRLTFTSELVRAIDHLLSTEPPYGTYNCSNEGDIVSWADIARQIYTDAGYNDLTVGDTTAEEYFAGKVSSPRPTYSGLDLTKLQATGFVSTDWRVELKNYLGSIHE